MYGYGYGRDDEYPQFPIVQVCGIEKEFEYTEGTLCKKSQGIRRERTRCGLAEQFAGMAERDGQQQTHEQEQNTRTCKNGCNADEEIADTVPQIFRIVGMLYKTQRPRTLVDAEQLDLFDLVTEQKAHRGVGEFVHGRTDDTRIIHDRGAVFTAGTDKQLFAGMDKKACRHNAADGNEHLGEKNNGQLFHCCEFCGGCWAACCAA